MGVEWYVDARKDRIFSGSHKYKLQNAESKLLNINENR
jgi:hypothetical protein